MRFGEEQKCLCFRHHRQSGKADGRGELMLACTGKGRTPSPEKRDRRQLLINSEQVTSQVMPWTEVPGLCRRAPPAQPGDT
ncbi:MAG: hypothetical protein ACPIOQ_39510, partial [Promethearchaeia archaeon]